MAILALFYLLRDVLWRQTVGSPPVAVRLLRGLMILLAAGSIFFQAFRFDRHAALEFLSPGLLALGVFVGGLIIFWLNRRLPRLRVFLVALLVAAPFWTWACVDLADSWHAGYTAQYDEMLFGGGLQILDKRRNNRDVVCVLDHRYYPLLGSRRDWLVCQPDFVPSPEWLTDYFRRHEVTYVYVKLRMPRGGWQGLRGFDDCLARYPGAFRLVHLNGGRAIYEVRIRRLPNRPALKSSS